MLCVIGIASYIIFSFCYHCHNALYNLEYVLQALCDLGDMFIRRRDFKLRDTNMARIQDHPGEQNIIHI